MDPVTEVQAFAGTRFLTFLLFQKLFSAGWLLLISGYARLLLQHSNWYAIDSARSIISEGLIPFHYLTLLKSELGHSDLPYSVIDQLVVAATQRIWSEGRALMRRGFARMDMRVLDFLYGNGFVLRMFDQLCSIENRDIAGRYWVFGAPLFNAARSGAGIILRDNTFALTPIRVTERKCHI